MPNVSGQRKSTPQNNRNFGWRLKEYLKSLTVRLNTLRLGTLNRIPGAGTSPLIRRILANSSYLFSATGIVAVLSLIQNILVGRIAGVTGVGLLATIILFTSVINKLASFRMSELVIKYIGLYMEEDETYRAAATFKAACLVELIASIFAFFLVILLAPLAARWLAKDPAMTSLFMLYAIIILANLVAESSTGLMQIFNRYRGIALMSVWGGIVTLIGVAVVYAFNQSENSMLENAVPGILIAYILGKVASAIGLTTMAMQTASQNWGRDWWRVSVATIRPQARELVNFAVSTNLSASLSLINKDAEALWISLFRSPTETGFYRTALSLINLVQMPVSPLPQATYPELSREVARRNWRSVSEILRRSSLLSGIFTLVISFGLILLGQQLILFLYRDPGFLPAYPALMILLPGFFIANTFFWNRIALLALGRPDFPTKLNFVLALTKLGGIFLLVPKFGYLASAALLSGSYLIGVTIAVLKSRSILRQNQVEDQKTGYELENTGNENAINDGSYGA